MYDDYLKGRVQYSEAYPNVNMFKNADRILEQKKPKKRQSRNQNGRNSMAQRTVRNKKYNTQNRNYLKELDGYGKQTKRHCDGLLDGIKKILNLVMIVGIALLGANKILDEKSKSYNPEYAPEGTAPTYTEQGKYEGTDTKTRLKNKIIDEAKKQGVKPEQALALAHWETRGRFNTDAYNPVSKAAGIFQVTPVAAQQVGVDYEKMKKDEDLQIKAGVAYLKWLLPQFGGDFQKAAGAYNWGIGNVQTKGIENAPKETRDYIREAPKLEQQYKQELSQLKTEKPQINLSGLSAGKTRKVKNDEYVGGYKMTNPNTARGYIELSGRAETYLKDVGGKGIITSGAEGKHAPGEISHSSGNKIDVQGFKGKYTTNRDYAELCIPFLKNKNTAYVNLESFTQAEIDDVVRYIKQMDMQAYNIGMSSTQYSPGKCFWNQGKVLCAVNTGLPKHLDIGIKPTAYSEKQYKEEQKKIKEETPVNVKKADNNSKEIKKTEKKVNAEMVKPSVSSTSSKPTTINIPSSKPKPSQPMKDVGQQGIVEKIRGQNKSYVQARK